MFVIEPEGLITVQEIAAYTVILCSHVLEHVLDDKQAMREFYRVLMNDQWAIILVPITSETTFEDSSIVDPEGRLKAFGQHDHVRRYGPDYVERLCDAGFTVETTKVGDLATSYEAVRMGLVLAGGDRYASGAIYYCTK